MQRERGPDDPSAFDHIIDETGPVPMCAIWRTGTIDAMDEPPYIRSTIFVDLEEAR